MKWLDIVAQLDEIRVKIRSTKNLKHDVPADDPIFDELAILNRARDAVVTLGTMNAPPPPAFVGMTEAGAVPEDIWTDPKPAAPAAQIVDRGEGEGRMVLPPRDTPLIVRKPVLDEVLDEKELGK